MPPITRARVKGYVSGEDSGLRVLTKVMSQNLSTMTEWHSGSLSLPSGSSSTVDFNTITDAKMVIIETSASCTVTMADSQKVNVDGLAMLRVWTNKDVVAFSIVQTRGAAVTVNWIAVS